MPETSINAEDEVYNGRVGGLRRSFNEDPIIFLVELAYRMLGSEVPVSSSGFFSLFVSVLREGSQIFKFRFL